MIKHIIFDLDNTLVDASEIHFQTFSTAVFNVTGIVITREYHQEHLNGLPTLEKLNRLSITNTKWISDIYKLKQEHTSDLFNNLSTDYELSGILSYLINDGYILSCASNSIRNTVVLALKRLRIDDYFSSVYSNSDVKEPKPSPEVYYKCMFKVGIYVPQTLIIEDSLVGAEAIQRSGCKGLMVRDRKDLTYEKIINSIYNG